MKLVYPALEYLQFISVLPFHNRDCRKRFDAVPFQCMWIIHVVGTVDVVYICSFCSIRFSVDCQKELTWARTLQLIINFHPLYFLRSVRAVQAAFSCIRKSVENLKLTSKPRVVLVSDNPSLVKDIAPDLNQFAEVSWFFQFPCCCLIF